MSVKNNIIKLAESEVDAAMVAIDEDAIRALEWPGGATSLPSWDWVITDRLKESGDAAQPLMFWMLGIAQAFRFWFRDECGSVRKYKHMGLSGTNAMLKGLMVAWGDGVTPRGLRESDVSEQFIQDACGDIPRAGDRALMLQEMLRGDLLERAADYFMERAATGCISSNDALWLADQFPVSYGNDPYLKKAQLFCSAVSGFLSARGSVVYADLTAMADYQVPRVLRALGVIAYSSDLERRIECGDLLREGSPEERAIRAATVIACEMIGRDHGISSVVVDNVLWSSQDIAGAARFHLTDTCSY